VRNRSCAHGIVVVHGDLAVAEHDDARRTSELVRLAHAHAQPTAISGLPDDEKFAVDVDRGNVVVLACA
jgi:hypothetical protein